MTETGSEKETTAPTEERTVKRLRPRPFAALRHRDFRLFWIGQAVSLIGTWMQSVGQSWLVLQLTDSSFLLGVVSSLQFAPVLLLSLFAGAIIDRFSKRRILIVTQAALMFLALILATLTATGVVRYWHILVMATLLGIVQTLDNPTRQAFIIELVGKDDLMNAIALNSTNFNIARIIGPALAGVLTGTLGIAAAFYANALSFVAVLISLLLIRVPNQPRLEMDRNIISNIATGLTYIRKTPIVLTTILLVAVLSTFAMNFNVLVPVYARNVLGLDAKGYGLLMSAMGVGALGGALSLASFSSGGPQRAVLLAGAVGLPLVEMLLSPVRSFAVAGLLLALVGWSMISFSASANTIVQVNTPDQFRGRVMSVYTLVFGGTTPFGSLFAGSIANWAGAPVALLAGGAIGLCAAIPAVFKRRSWFRPQEEKLHPEPPSPESEPE